MIEINVILICKGWCQSKTHNELCYYNLTRSELCYYEPNAR